MHGIDAWRSRITAVLLFVSSSVVCLHAEDDWRGWRGPHRDGTAANDQSPPTGWTVAKNVVWKAAVPGRGHSSPIVVKDKVLLTTADERRQVQSVLCYNRQSGEALWKTDVNQGGFPERIHIKNTHASPTLASDGNSVFAVFDNHGQAQLTALDLGGTILWQKPAGDYLPKQYQYGYAPSPLVYQATVIVSSEFEGDAFIAAFACDDGREIWRTARAPNINYSSPVVGNVAGREQLLISGSKTVSAYDPSTGKQLWSVPGLWDVTCGTMIWDEERVFASGGYPGGGTMAVKADGSGEVLWQNRVKCYEQSMVTYQGFVYAVSDQGVAYCWNAANGREMWKYRLGGAFSASPVVAGGNIYATNENGTTFVFKASSRKMEPVAQNQLGEEGFATPAFCNDRIYIRAAATAGGPRREMLYCLGD